MPRATLCIDDYDCVGFDLDHTLCRYNVGPLIRLEYDLLAEFLVAKKGYDPAIRQRNFDLDLDLVCKGLTLDCERGNLLRLAADGGVLAACHGTRRLSDNEVERAYGRCRKRHAGHEYTQHLAAEGPRKMVDFGLLLHSFMDYFDIAAPLLCARIVDVVDQLNNGGKPMEEYFFWPDVQEGLRDMFVRTNFAADVGGFFPEVKLHPEKYILKRRPEFREWLKMLRANGKCLYVITGSHTDFASHVASHALGHDWKDLFDIVIFFARKPSFFVEERPFWRLDGAAEVESFQGWEDLETGDCYSQGNWKDLNEFLEYVTEWQPSASLYFGDNVLQDVLAPKKFTATIDSVAVCEELMAEGMVNHPPIHPHAQDIVSRGWGSYFFSPDPRVVKNKSSVLGRASSLKKASASGGSPDHSTQHHDDMKRALSLRRAVAGARTPQPTERATTMVSSQSQPRLCGITPRPASVDPSTLTRSATPQSSKAGTPEPAAAGSSPPATELPTGPKRINTLWGCFIRDYAKMCIPDLDVLVDYPIDYSFPAFGKNRKGETVCSGFFPADPACLHTPVPIFHTII